MLAHKLNRAGGVVCALCRKICGVREFGRCKPTEPHLFAAYNYRRCPSAFTRGDSEKTRNVSALRDPQVLPVFRPVYGSEIAPSVVASVSVYMVNLSRGPSVGRVEPCQPMGKIPCPVYPNATVAGTCVDAICTKTRAGMGAWSTLFCPYKNTRSSVVIKQFAQACCGKIGLSHDTVPSLIGQRPGRVISTSGLRYFITHACSGAAEITKCLHQAARAAASVCMPANHRRFSNPFGALTPFNAL